MKHMWFSLMAPLPGNPGMWQLHLRVFVVTMELYAVVVFTLGFKCPCFNSLKPQKKIKHILIIPLAVSLVSHRA